MWGFDGRRFAIRPAALAALAAAIIAAGAPAAAQDSRASSFGAVPEIRGQLTPRQYTTLSSEMSGQIERINTRVGERFKTGTVLVAFDCAIQRAQQARASAEVVKADKTVVINQRLVQLRSIGQLEVDISRAELDKARADLSMTDTAVSKCSVPAPFDGITVEQKARAFQFATPGQPLLDIIDTSALETELIVPSRWLAWLRPGFLFQMQIDETGKSYPVRVTRLGGRVDPVSQSIKVIGEITVEAPELMAGMSGRATMREPERGSAEIR